MTSPPLGKTDPPLSLREHTEDVISEAETVLAWLRYPPKYRQLTGADLRERLLRAATYHDKGKAHPRWQKHARNESLLTVGLRHELATLRMLDDEGIDVDDPTRVAIAAHHGKLGHYYRDRWTSGGDGYDAHTSYWQAMRRLQRQGRQAAFDDLVRRRYAFDVVRGLLQLADRRASQIENPDAPDPLPLRPLRYPFPHDTPTPVQEEALAHASERVVALRSETGSGKTAASLLWAREQVRNQRARRAILALPTRFTATSLAADTADDVTSGLYHSSAWQQLEDDDRAFEKLALARQFLFPLTVTTIDQVLTCLTGRREEDHLRFANLAHSCLIIDECDFYDDVVQANIQYLMRVLRVLDVPVLVMSATLPDAHVRLYYPAEADAPAPVDTTEADAGLRIASLRDLELPPPDDAENADSDDVAAESVAWLKTLVRDEPKVIVYANTVARAIAYYDAICEVREDVTLYHSRFTEPHKADKEREIRSRLGPDGTSGVAVMTQIGEMSLNVSAQVMVSDLCPIDRLAQRTGRLCRFESGQGRLHLVRPTRHQALYPAPYGTLERGSGWKPSSALLKTERLLEAGQEITKLDFRELTNEVYEDAVRFSREAQQNQNALDEEFRAHWLIQPTASSDADDTQTERWQSRMIPPQVEVFVDADYVSAEYDSYRDFQRDVMQHTVSIPSYRLRQFPDRFQSMTVPVGIDDEETVHAFSAPSPYDSRRGAIL